MPLGSFKTALLGAAGVSGSANFVGWFEYDASYRLTSNPLAKINSSGQIACIANMVDGSSNYVPYLFLLNEDLTFEWQKSIGAINSYESLADPPGLTFSAGGDVVCTSSGVWDDSGWNTDTGYSPQGPGVIWDFDKVDGSKNAGRVRYKAKNSVATNGGVGTAGSTYTWEGWHNSDSGNGCLLGTSGAALDTTYFVDTIGSPFGGGFWTDDVGGNGDYFAGIFIVWMTISGTTMYRPCIFDNNGTNQLNYQILHNASLLSDAYYAGGITCDSSNNKYLALWDGNDEDPCSLLKLSGSTSASMTIDWQNHYRGKVSAYKMKPFDVEIDSSGNNYMVGYVQATANGYTGYHSFIMKHNSSGVLQWSRLMDPVHSGTAKFSSFYSVDVADDDESIVVTGKFDDASNDGMLVVARLAADGTGTGTYVTGGDIGTIDYFDGSAHIETASQTLTASTATMNGQSDWMTTATTASTSATVLSAQTFVTEAL
jgi:hypothetical protein